MNMTEMVREFHRAFLVDCPKQPAIPSRDIAVLRSSLIDEERLELVCATTPVGVLDAIADLLYVVHGAALAYGFNGNQVEAALDAVRRSSPSRPWTRKEVIAGIDEERLELFVATTPADAMDAIAGLLYVVHRAAPAYGFNGEQVEAAFREVHRSNMSKLWTREEVDAGIGDNIARPVLGEMFVVTRPDGKVVKSPSYSPAQLEEIAGGAQ